MKLSSLWPFKTAADLEKKDRETTTLKRVKWTETRTETLTDVTQRLTWSGGAGKEVTYTREHSEVGWGDYMRRDRDTGDIHQVLSVDPCPTIVEPVSREEWDFEYEETRYAWVTEVPPGVEETGKTKEITHKD
jgi:hypothetical protein